jgi:hypothetical protein
VVIEMGNLQGYYAKCRKILCQTAKRRQPITYGGLANALGLRSPRQQWNTVLNPICTDEKKKTGYDLTLVVVYSASRSKCKLRHYQNLRRLFRSARAAQSVTEKSCNGTAHSTLATV